MKGVIFSFPSVDYEKYYTFYVRSKINNYCGNTQLWSEWSVPVFWGNNSTSKGSSSPERPRSPRRPRSVLTVSPGSLQVWRRSSCSGSGFTRC